AVFLNRIDHGQRKGRGRFRSYENKCATIRGNGEIGNRKRHPRDLFSATFQSSPIHLGFVRRPVRRSSSSQRSRTLSAISRRSRFSFRAFFGIVRIAFEPFERD